MIASAVFMIIAYLSGHLVFANYLQIHHTPGSGELAVFCGAIVGRGDGVPVVQRPAGEILWATPARWPWAARWERFRW
jgi:hypothetical protein